MAELKPCPFCGNYNVSVKGIKKYWVSCPKCGCEGPTNRSRLLINYGLWETEEDAIRAWNHREDGDGNDS